ncbi:MAG: tetratricopeptide repeat protein [Armatimonadota bacterium]|jgi:tetratricopeptide (TPR) repeat protein
MRAHAIAWILIVAVCVVAFGSALGNEFVWDDELIITNNPGIRDLSHPLKFFSPRYWMVVRANYRGMPKRGYRPLPELLFAVDYAVWGLNPIGYHAVNIAVHAINCVLLYALAHRILRTRVGAMFCALLFAAHPVHVEAVVWAKARSELLALLFVLAAILLYDRYLSRPADSRRVHLHVLSIAAFALALTCKASAAVLPALLLLYVWCVVPRWRWRRGVLGLVPLAGIVGAFFAVKAPLPYIPGPLHMVGGSPALTGIAALGIYMKLLLAPAGLCAHHSVHTARTVFDPSVLRGLALSAALVAGGLVAARRSRAAFFAVGWTIVALAPLSVLELMGRRVGELRAYAPSVGFCLVVAFLLSSIATVAPTRVPRASLARLAAALCAFLVITYTALSALRTLDWADEVHLWHDTVAKNPGSWHGLAGLSEEYIQRGMYDEARPLLERLVRLDPTPRAAWYRLATVYQETGRPGAAAKVYNRLVAEDPDDGRAWAALGALLGKTGEHSRAMAHFERALRVSPGSAYVHRHLGAYYTNTGRYREALAEMSEALRLKPDSPSTLHLMGAVYDAMGSPAQALEYYRRSTQLRPESVATWLSLAACYERLGDVNGAVRCYRRCAAMRGPLAEQAKQHLARLRAGR